MKNYIDSQQHWEDSVNSDYDKQKQIDKNQTDNRTMPDNRIQLETIYDSTNSISIPPPEDIKLFLEEYVKLCEKYNKQLISYDGFEICNLKEDFKDYLEDITVHNLPKSLETLAKESEEKLRKAIAESEFKRRAAKPIQWTPEMLKKQEEFEEAIKNKMNGKKD